MQDSPDRSKNKGASSGQKYKMEKQQPNSSSTQMILNLQDDHIRESLKSLHLPSNINHEGEESLNDSFNQQNTGFP